MGDCVKEGMEAMGVMHWIGEDGGGWSTLATPPDVGLNPGEEEDCELLIVWEAASVTDLMIQPQFRNFVSCFSFSFK